MVTTFNKKDLRSFYAYMISDKRREFYTDNPNSAPVEERLKTVNGGDIERWISWEKEKKRGK